MDMGAKHRLFCSSERRLCTTENPKQKLVFIAGGIGITPYRSMVKYLLDTKEVRTITMLYSARTTDGFAYKESLKQARMSLV